MRMIRVDEHGAIRKERDVFRAELRISAKRSDHRKFASKLARDLGREIPVQLNAAHSGDVCSFPNFLGISVNENTDCRDVSW